MTGQHVCIEVVTLIQLYILIVTSQAITCPTGCQCRQDSASCVNLFALPKPFRSDARHVDLYLSRFQEIPPHAFREEDLPNMETLSIRQVQIGRIRSCAFRNMRNLTRFSIYQADIDTIEANAFTGLSFKGGMSIYMSNIKRIQPFAFSHFHGLRSFSIYEATVEIIQSYAFSSLSGMKIFSLYKSNLTTIKSGAFHDFKNISSASVYDSRIDSIGCNTFDKLRQDLGLAFSIYDLRVVCDCNIAWLVEASKTYENLLIGSVVCFQPAQLNNTSVNTLTREQLCGNTSNTPSVCETPTPPTPLSCDVMPTSSSTSDTGAGSQGSTTQAGNQGCHIALSSYAVVLFMWLTYFNTSE